MIKKFDNRIEVWRKYLGEDEEVLILTPGRINDHLLFLDTFGSESSLTKDDVRQLIPYLQEFVSDNFSHSAIN